MPSAIQRESLKTERRPPTRAELFALTALAAPNRVLMVEHSQQRDAALVADTADDSFKLPVQRGTAASLVRRGWVKQTAHGADVTLYELSAEGRAAKEAEHGQ